MKQLARSSSLASTLEEAILCGEYKSGTFLPSAKVLEEKYSASTRALREAFRVLESKGLLEVSQGRRAFVRTGCLDKYYENLTFSIVSSLKKDKSVLDDIVDTLTSIELDSISQLCAGPSSPDVSSLAASICRNDEFAFHRVLVSCNDNIVSRSIALSLLVQLSSAIGSADGADAARLGYYNATVDALRDRDRELASSFVRICGKSIKAEMEVLFDDSSARQDQRACE